MKYTILIADDEPNARAYLRRLLLQDEEVEIIKECKNGTEVISFLAQKRPDIVFLDVEMPGATGLEVSEQLSSEIAVIFTTAYEQYAVEAFEFEALDYLLKPFDEERFQLSLSRGKKFIENRRQNDLSKKMLAMIEEYKKEETSPNRVLEIKKKGFIKKIYAHDILFIKASSVYAELHTEKGMELYRSSLQELEELMPDPFLRIHRSYIINKNKIKSVRYNNDNTYVFEMENGSELNSGRSYKKNIVNSF